MGVLCLAGFPLVFLFRSIISAIIFTLSYELLLLLESLMSSVHNLVVISNKQKKYIIFADTLVDLVEVEDRGKYRL